jgi:hypothetical protein
MTYADSQLSDHWQRWPPEREITVAIRDGMRDSAAQFLQPGETLQAILLAQTESPQVLSLMGTVGAHGDVIVQLFRPVWARARPIRNPGALGDIIGMVLSRYRIIAVTDQRILVLDAGRVRASKARGVVSELPRLTQLGPAAGKWHVIPVGAEQLRVHRRFFKEIVDADRYARIITHRLSSRPQRHEPPAPG